MYKLYSFIDAFKLGIDTRPSPAVEELNITTRHLTMLCQLHPFHILSCFLVYPILQTIVFFTHAIFRLFQSFRFSVCVVPSIGSRRNVILFMSHIFAWSGSLVTHPLRCLQCSSLCSSPLFPYSVCVSLLLFKRTIPFHLLHPSFSLLQRHVAHAFFHCWCAFYINIERPK